MKIVVIGGTFAGVSAAYALAKAGHDVTLVDAHSYLGGDVVACQHTWILNGRSGCRADRPNGRTKMELYAEMRDAGVRLLLMARLCGLIQRGDRIGGAVLATKYGVYEVCADLVIDATEGGEAAAQLTGKRPEATQAEYGFDMQNVNAVMEDFAAMPKELGLIGDRVLTGWTMRSRTANISFRFPVNGEDRGTIERRAHELMAAAAMILKKDNYNAEADVLLVGSHTRLFYREAVRCGALPFVEADLPAEFTTEELRACREKAASKALALAEQAAKADAAGKTVWLSMGKPVTDWHAAEEDELGLRKLTFDFEAQGFARRQTDVLVAGAGAGGAMSAWALCERGADVLLADWFYYAGGTNTVGRVFGAWHGYNAARFTARLQKAAEQADAAGMDKRISAMLFWDRLFDGKLLGGVTVCGAVREGRRVTGVLVCGENGFELIRSRFVIDGTADGDVCAFAGLDYTIGGDRDGMVQTSSMSGFEYNLGMEFPMSRYSSDEDVIDPDSYADLLRGFGLGYLKNSEYEIVEMCMQRESRRFDCRKGLTMAGIARRETFEDTIAVGLCTHDSHGRTSSLMNQLNLFSKNMIEDGSKDIRIRMPFGMFLPKVLDNVAIVGKSMSGEREAVSLCRMNPDISNSGYAVGAAVAAALVQDAERLDAVDLLPVQAELRAVSVLPDWADAPSDALGAAEAMAALDDAADAGFSAMVQKREEIVPLLMGALNDAGVWGDNAAMALAWHGCKEAAPRLLEMLARELEKDAVRFEKRENYEIYAVMKDGSEKIANPNMNYGYVTVTMDDPDCAYGRVNRLLVLLGLAGGEGLDEALSLGENVYLGEIISGRKPYARSRMDGHCVMGEDRLWSVIHAVERLADRRAAKVLEKLMDEAMFEGIAVQKGSWQRVPAPRVTQLYLSLARAAAHCGSRKGAEALIEYLDDGRAVFAKMAQKALEEVYGLGLCGKAAWTKALADRTELPVSAYRGDPWKG